MTVTERLLVITREDREALARLLRDSRRQGGFPPSCLAALEGELGRARTVRAAAVPPDVITMHSTVRLRDLDTGEAEVLTLVYPEEADVARGRTSVLAPVGTALLGYREGDVIEWPVPSRMRRLKVEAVLFQPERSADDLPAQTG